MLEIATHQEARTATRVSEARQAERLGLVPALLSISKSIRAMHGLKLGELGFANGQDELLIAIPENGLAVNEMADRLAVRPSTVSKMMDRLVAKGLILRVPDQRDGRRTMIHITPAGLEARKEVIRIRSELDDNLCRALDEDQVAGIQACLDDCAEQLAKRLRRLR